MVIQEADIRAFTCRSIGFAAITEVHIRKTPTKRKDFPFKFELRQGHALFGMVQNEANIGGNPFDERFSECTSRGVGYTMEAAIRALEKDQKQLREGLWV